MSTTINGIASPDAPEDVRNARREAARATLGITGDSVKGEPIRPVLRQYGLTVYPMVALGLLGVVSTLQGFAFTVLTPEISRSLGLSLGAIAGARTLAFLAAILAPLPMAALAQNRGRRAMLCIVTGVAWSVITMTTGFVTSLFALMAVLVLEGLSTGTVGALHSPLLVDSYPPKARVRVLSIYAGFLNFSTVISPLLVGLLAGPLDLTWRGVFLGLGVLSVLTSLVSLGLTDPGPGKFDTELLREQERSKAEAATGDVLRPKEVEMHFFESVRRVLLIPTVKRLSVGYFVVGILIIPFGTFLATFLEQDWGLGPGERGLFFAGTAALSIVALALYAPLAERWFRTSPKLVLRLCGVFLMVAVVFIAAGAMVPSFAVMFVLFAIGQAFLAMITPGMTAGLMSITDARFRPHASAVVGIFTASGSLLGVLFLTGMDQRFGLSGAIVALMVPGFIGGLIIQTSGNLIDQDLDHMIEEVLDGEDIRLIEASGGHLPMLSCRKINFSYGQMQVLFDVDFTVDDGEMVALLGTNGAGKSTLLKVVSGIGLPTRGNVRFHGADITYLDAERRVPLGITQVPGGRAVFGSCDVVENLRAFGYTVGSNRKRIDEAIDLCFDAFPRLEERRTSLAANLSGGEQQMLALSKALILQPRLLLIDELSLGLAPVVVGKLLDMVRRINADGTAVVLVEQSVNIALSVVDHAYFMEKGEMRFDGPAKDLLARNDLLRAVFLEGASKAEDR